MAALGHHITFRLENDRNLGDSIEGRRAIARIVLEVARPFLLLAFRWADTHGHAVTADDRATAGELVRRIEIALNLALATDAPFAAARVRPIVDAAHLRNAFTYVLRQDEKHGLEADPFRDASNLPDLIGARVLGTWTAAHVRRFLPRMGRADILGAAGLQDPDGGPTALDLLYDAAAGAIGRADLTGREDIVVAARRAAVHVAAGEDANAIAEALGLSARAVRRLRTEEADPALVRAVRLQGGMRSRSRDGLG